MVIVHTENMWLVVGKDELKDSLPDGSSGIMCDNYVPGNVQLWQFLLEMTTDQE